MYSFLLFVCVALCCVVLCFVVLPVAGCGVPLLLSVLGNSMTLIKALCLPGSISRVPWTHRQCQVGLLKQGSNHECTHADTYHDSFCCGSEEGHKGMDAADFSSVRIQLFEVKTLSPLLE